MSTSIANLHATIGADTGGFTRGMAGVDSSLKSTGGRFTNFTTGIVQGIGQAFGQAAIRGLRKFGDALGDSIGSSAKAEQDLANIRADLSLTAEEAERAGKYISALGLDPKLKVNATEAADAIHALGKNGLELEQILGGAARATVLLANSTGADFGGAADIATAAMAQFKIKAEDMTGAIDQIVGVTQSSRFDINDYRLALAQAGGVAGSVGVSFEDFNASIAAISPLFASGSDAGTSFKTFLQRLVPASTDAEDAMKGLGIMTMDLAAAGKRYGREFATGLDLANFARDFVKNTTDMEEGSESFNKAVNRMIGPFYKNEFFDAQGNIKSMADIAGVLKEAITGIDPSALKALYDENGILKSTEALDALMASGEMLNDMDKIKAFSEIFGTDAMRAAFAMVDAGAEGINNLKQELKDTSAEEAAAIRMDTLIGQWEIFRGIVDESSKQIGDKFKPHLKELVKWLTQMATEKGPAAIAFFGKVADQLPAIGAWGMKAFGGIAKTIAALRAPLGRAWEIFNLLFTGLRKNNLGIFTSGLRGAMMDLQRFVGNLFGTLDGVSFTDKLVTWTSTFVTWAAAIWQTVSPFLAAFARDFIGWVTSPAVVNGVKSGLISGWTMFADWAGQLWGYVQPKLVQLWNYLSSWVTDPAKRQSLTAALLGTWNAFADWAGSIWTNNIQPGLLTAWDNITSWVTDPAKRQSLLDGLHNGWNAFADWATSIWATSIQPGLGEAWAGLTSWVADPAKRSELLDGIGATWTAFADWAGALWAESIYPGLVSMWGSLTSWVTDPAKRQAIYKGLTDTWTGFKDWASDLWTVNLQPKLSETWKLLSSWVTDPAKRQELAQKAAGAWTGFTDWAGNIWNWVAPKLGEVGTAIMGWIRDNVPVLAPWIDAVVKFATDTAKAFSDNLPGMTQEVKDLGATVAKEVPLIGQHFTDMWSLIFGGGTSDGKTFTNFLSSLFRTIVRDIGTILTQIRILMDAMKLLSEATSALTMGDFSRLGEIGSEFGNLTSEFGSSISNQWDAFSSMFPGGGTSSDQYSSGGSIGGGYALGGTIPEDGQYMVGEYGRELVTLPAGAQVTNAQDTAGMLSGNRLEIVIKNEGNISANRSVIDQIAVELERRLALRGARVVLT